MTMRRSLLCGALLGPCLYLDPLPPSIYVLIEYLPSEPDSIKDLWEQVRRLCVYQSIKIRPVALGTDARGTEFDTRIARLSSRAETFLRKVPYIRSMYRPADSALTKLYRKGSDWHRLHMLVATDQRSHIDAVKSLCDELDPTQIVATLHEHADLVTLTRPLEGSVRAKLERHLHNSLGMAREWLRLVLLEEDFNGRETQEQRRVANLVKELRTLLPKCLKDLDTNSDRSSARALARVLANILYRIQEGDVTLPGGIHGDLIGLIGLPLDDDLEPSDDTLVGLQSAILHAETSASVPGDVIAECLFRHEYRRAKLIIRAYGLGTEAKQAYKRAVKESRVSLRDELLNLETQVEDAFLLGQLRDTTLEMAGDEAQDSPVLERTRLIAKIQDAKANLESSGQYGADCLREIAETARSVSEQIKDLASSRRQELAERFDNVVKDLPETDQGRSDREYLEREFDACRSQNDDVAAFDLLERAFKAIQKGEPIARSTIGFNQDLETFYSEVDRYCERLDDAEWLQKFEKSIRHGKIVAGIDFGHLDQARRDEAVSSLRTWETLGRIRLTGARREIGPRITALAHFLGFRVRDVEASVLNVAGDGFAHVIVKLNQPIRSSPLPAFGSTCGTRLDIVVSQKRTGPEEVGEFARGRQLVNSSVLVLVCPPLRLKDRFRWKRHCVGRQLTLLPLDRALFVRLCAETNRLGMLLEFGLPSTWSRPYITKGENVAREMFVGRHQEASALIDPLGGCIVFGGRQLGKSVLLRHVKNENHDPESERFVIYVDVNTLGLEPQTHDEMLTQFWRRVHDRLKLTGAIEGLPPVKLSRPRQLVDEVSAPHRNSARQTSRRKDRIAPRRVRCPSRFGLSSKLHPCEASSCSYGRA